MTLVHFVMMKFLTGAGGGVVLRYSTHKGQGVSYKDSVREQSVTVGDQFVSDES